MQLQRINYVSCFYFYCYWSWVLLFIVILRDKEWLTITKPGALSSLHDLNLAWCTTLQLIQRKKIIKANNSTASTWRWRWRISESFLLSTFSIFFLLSRYHRRRRSCCHCQHCQSHRRRHRRCRRRRSLQRSRGRGQSFNLCSHSWSCSLCCRCLHHYGCCRHCCSSYCSRRCRHCCCCSLYYCFCCCCHRCCCCRCCWCHQHHLCQKLHFLHFIKFWSVQKNSDPPCLCFARFGRKIVFLHFQICGEILDSSKKFFQLFLFTLNFFMDL